MSRLESFQSAHLFSLLWSYSNSGQLDHDMHEKIRDVLLKRAEALDSANDVESPLPSDLFTPIRDSHPYILKDFGDVCIVYKPPYMNVSVDGDLSERDAIQQEQEEEDDDASSSSSLKSWIQSSLPSPIANSRVHAHGILHRLDTLTSGPLLVARTHRGFYSLRVEFATQQINKEYLALCHGILPSHQRLDNRLKQVTVYNDLGVAVSTKTEVSQQGKPAATLINNVDYFTKNDNKYSLANVSIITGRTHQIRAHLSHAGHPLVTDGKYNRSNYQNDKQLFPRTFLHCQRLGFSRGDADCPLPADLATPLVSLRF